MMAHFRTLTQAMLEAPDHVSRPAHYTQGKIEVLDFIEDQNLDYHLGNVVKYVCRSAHKGDAVGDLKKALTFLVRRIERMEGGR